MARLAKELKEYLNKLKLLSTYFLSFILNFNHLLTEPMSQIEIKTSKPNNMKTIKNQLLILALCFCGILQAQQTTVTVTLTVNTDLLGDNAADPGGCTFSVVPADKVLVNDPNNPKTFTISVDESDVIEWEGITTTGQKVKIKKINFLRGTNILGAGINEVKGTINDGREKVKIKPSSSTRNDDFEYSITFKTKVLGKSYVIDPKIKVGSQ